MVLATFFCNLQNSIEVVTPKNRAVIKMWNKHCFIYRHQNTLWILCILVDVGPANFLKFICDHCYIIFPRQSFVN